MEIVRTRVIRSTRQPDSSYKVDVARIGPHDTLRLEIAHEDNPDTPFLIYFVAGRHLQDRNSLHFRFEAGTNGWGIRFSGIPFPHT